MLESFKQQEQMSVLELYIEKDVTGDSMFHSANSLISCGNYLSNDETQLPTNMSNLHIDEDDNDDDDYLVSNSYVEESLDEDDSVDGISNTDDEVIDMIQPVRIVHPTEGIENPFWNDALHYNNINWSYLDEEDICGLEMPSTFNVGEELYVCMEFDSNDAIKNAVKQYVMKVHQSFKVVESKSNKYSALHYPCSHIIAACGYVSMNYYQYIDVVYTNEHILKAYSAQWWPLGNEAAIPPSNDAWTLIPDPTTNHAKG
ncbi:hypothetical protein GmHk_09G025481 [Glycine max]|nr:hypothetical protein GmHk_09G025481 [Glycine max]